MKSLIISLLLVATSLVVVAQAPTSFNIYFDYNSSNIDVDRANVIKSHLANYRVDSIVCYASSEGNTARNHSLAMYRGLAVNNICSNQPIRIVVAGATSQFGSDKSMNRVAIVYCTYIGNNDVYTDNYQSSHTSGFVRAASYGTIPEDISSNSFINVAPCTPCVIEPIKVDVTVKLSIDSFMQIPQPIDNQQVTKEALKQPKILFLADAVKHYQAKGLSLTDAIAEVDKTIQDGLEGKTDLYVYRGKFNKGKAQEAAYNWKLLKRKLMKQS